MASSKEAFTLISKKSTMAGIVVIGLVVALAGGYFWWCSRPSPPPPYTGPVEKLSLGTTTIMSTLLWVADQNGYFQAQGLDVTIQMYDAGLFAVNDLLAGKVQVAACAEFVLATKIVDGIENLRGLGTIGSSHNHKIIVRRDRGIAKPEDLAGKRIGVTRQTIGDYFLDLFLTFHGLAIEQVQLVNLRPQEMAEALSRGQVDAVITWGTFVYTIEKQMGEEVVSWPGQIYQSYYWMLISTPQFIQAKPEVLIRMFRALARAEEFVKQHPGAAKEITARRIAMPLDYMEYCLSVEKYELKMGQRVLMAMEDEARWAIRHNLTDKKDIPNYLDYLYLEPMAAVKPGAVKLMAREKKPNQ